MKSNAASMSRSVALFGKQENYWQTEYAARQSISAVYQAAIGAYLQPVC